MGFRINTNVASIAAQRTLSQNSVLLQIEIFDENFENINNFLLKQGFHFLMKISSDHYYKKL